MPIETNYNARFLFVCFSFIQLYEYDRLPILRKSKTFPLINHNFLVNFHWYTCGYYPNPSIFMSILESDWFKLYVLSCSIYTQT